MGRDEMMRRVCRSSAPLIRAYSAPASAANPVQAAINDTITRFEKDGDFENCYEELVLRGFSDTDAINKVIDIAAKKKDEKAVTKLVEKMKADGIEINKRTVLVLRDLPPSWCPPSVSRLRPRRPRRW